MKLATITTQAQKQGDFYLYFRREDGRGQTYLVGTTEFDNPYILSRLHSRKNPCGLPFRVTNGITAKSDKTTRLSVLNKLVAENEKNNAVLVYSWSSDKFRLVSADKVNKLQPLASVVRNAG